MDAVQWILANPAPQINMEKKTPVSSEVDMAESTCVSRYGDKIPSKTFSNSTLHMLYN